MASNLRPINVMFVAFAAQGHINPMLQFAARLVAAAPDIITVTFALSESAHEKLLQANKNHKHIHFEFFSDGFTSDEERLKDINFYMERLSEIGSKTLEELILNLEKQGRSVTCIINNPFVPWVIDVADRLSIPCGLLWIQSCALFAIYYRHHHKLTHFELNHHADSSAEIQIPGLPTLKVVDLPSLVFPNDVYPVFDTLLKLQFEKLNKMRWVFANSVYDTEPEAVDSMAGLQPIKPVGALVPFSLLLDQSDLETETVRADMWKIESSCMDWLDSQADRSVIYVSLGSFSSLTGPNMTELAWGLKNSGVKFLWVARNKPDGLGPGLPTRFLDETVNQGMVVDWCSQTDVLRHRAVAGFLTHCGWNSTLETIVAGVPVVAFPQWTDQPTNAKFLVDVWGMGVRLRRSAGDVVGREEVERGIREVVAGERAEEMRRNAMKWRGVVVEAAATAEGTSARNIQEFVDDIISMKSS